MTATAAAPAPARSRPREWRVWHTCERASKAGLPGMRVHISRTRTWVGLWVGRCAPTPNTPPLWPHVRTARRAGAPLPSSYFVFTSMKKRRLSTYQSLDSWNTYMTRVRPSPGLASGYQPRGRARLLAAATARDSVCCSSVPGPPFFHVPGQPRKMVVGACASDAVTVALRGRASPLPRMPTRWAAVATITRTNTASADRHARRRLTMPMQYGG